MSGQFGWGGWALCKVCLAICSTLHLVNLLAVLWAAKMLICLAKGECFQNGEMKLFHLAQGKLNTLHIHRPTLEPSPLNICLHFSFLPDFWTQSFIPADSVECGTCEFLPIPPLDPIPQLGPGKGSPPATEVALPSQWNSHCKILQQQLCHVGRSWQTLFHGDFSQSLGLIQEYSLPGGSGAPTSTPPAPPAPSLMEKATNEAHSLREFGSGFVI